MKKQARLMRSQLGNVRNNLENTLVEGSAGSGLVKVTLNGAKDLKKIVIQPEAASDIEGLQDLIIGAFQDAQKKIESHGSPMARLFE